MFLLIDKVAIKTHRNCIIFSPEHTTVMGRLLAETTVLVSCVTGDKHINTNDFTILTVVKIKEQ